MSLNSQVKCDYCDQMADVTLHPGLFGNVSPMGWMTITTSSPLMMGTASSFTLSTAGGYERPDLCSWRCVAGYAARQAGIEPLR